MGYGYQRVGPALEHRAAFGQDDHVRLQRQRAGDEPDAQRLATTILSAITYDPFGPITSWTWGNGTAANRAFDTDGKITQVDNANGASLKNYGYDDAFRITGHHRCRQQRAVVDVWATTFSTG